MGSSIPPLNLSEKRSSTAKVMDIVKVLVLDPLGALGVTDIASRTQMSKSTVHRILQELGEAGAVESIDGQYIIAPWLIAQMSPVETSRSRELREILTPFLGQLFSLTSRTVQLAVLNGTEVLYLNKLSSSDPLGSPSRAGGRAPAYCTGVGKVLLAHNSLRAKSVLAGPLVRWTKNTKVSPQELARELEEIRARGYGYDREEIRLGLCCIAAPIFDKKGVAAAISVSGPATSDFDPDSYHNALQSVCQAATRALQI